MSFFFKGKTQKSLTNNFFFSLLLFCNKNVGFQMIYELHKKLKRWTESARKEQKQRRKWKQRGRKAKCMKRTKGGRGRQSCLLVGKTWAVILFPLWLHKHGAVCLRCWRGTSAETQTHQPTHRLTHSRHVRCAQTCLYTKPLNVFLLLLKQTTSDSLLAGAWRITFRLLRGRTSYLRS